MKVILTMSLAVAVTIAAFAEFLWAGSLGPAEDRSSMKTQLTIYVAPPLLYRGGTVIVIADPISTEAWKNLPEGENPAKADPNNEKKQTLAKDDLLYGAVASSTVSIVEFVYPEDGTYAYNFVAVEAPAEPRRPLRTSQLLIGSQKDGLNGKTKEASVIHIHGRSASENDSRAADAAQGRIRRMNPKKTVYEGVFLLSPTDEQIDAAIHFRSLEEVGEEK